jgi:hypothetical protein
VVEWCGTVIPAGNVPEKLIKRMLCKYDEIDLKKGLPCRRNMVN